jgi:hypothetical protein
MPTETQKGQIRLRKFVDSTGTHIQACQPGEGDGEKSFGAVLGEIFPSDFAALTAAPPGGSSSSTSKPSASSSTKDPSKLTELSNYHKRKFRAFAAKAAGKTTPSGSSTTTTPGKDLMNVLGETVSMDDLKKRNEAGKKALLVEAASQGHKLLAETIKPEGWDRRASRQLLSEGKVSPQQYAAFENAVELVEQGVKEAKIHPAHRTYYLADAISRPKEFEEMLRTAKPFVILDEHGLAGSSPEGRIHLAANDQLKQQISQYMKDNKCTYTKALKAVVGNNPEMARRLREESSGNRQLM